MSLFSTFLLSTIDLSYFFTIDFQSLCNILFYALMFMPVVPANNDEELKTFHSIPKQSVFGLLIIL